VVNFDQLSRWRSAKLSPNGSSFEGNGRDDTERIKQITLQVVPKVIKQSWNGPLGHKFSSLNPASGYETQTASQPKIAATNRRSLAAAAHGRADNES
jgi:hypothetical protein